MKCIVKDCKNHEHEGQFIGSLCSPCHTYITKGDGTHSQAYRNSKREWQGLTDEQISDLWCKVSNTDFVTVDTHEFARAIEAAHGIGENHDIHG